MMITTPLAALAVSLALATGCGGGDSVATPDAPDAPDAPVALADARTAALPTWMLEDIQPLSPRTGQTYGLDTFSGKIVVVTLVEGF